MGINPNTDGERFYSNITDEEINRNYLSDEEEKAMNQLQLPTKVLTKAEMPITAQTIADGMLETYNGIEACVMVKNMIETLTVAYELLKDAGIAKANGKEEIVMGAKVSVKNLPKKFEYTGSKHKTLVNNLEFAKEELKNHEKALQLSDWINPETGETETAKQIVQEKMRTLTITF